MNEDRVPCAKKGRWRNKDMKWSKGTISYILTNRTYAGVRIYNRHPMSHQKMPDKPKWENDEKYFVIKEAAHPAIISKDIFEKAQLIGKGKWARGAKSIVKSEYLLSGLIKCSKCGFNFQGWSHSSHKGKTHICYYIDGGYINKGKSVCSHLIIKKEKLESFVVEHIKKYFLTPDIYNKLHQVIERRIARLGLNKQSRLEQLEKQQTDVNTRIDNLVKIMESGVDIDNLVKRVRVLEEERKAIDEEIKKCSENNINRGDVQDLATQIAEGLKDLEVNLERGNTFTRKQLIRQFVRQIIIDRVSMKAICYIKKIPTVTHKLVDILSPSERSVIIVAGGHLTTYGKIDLFENQTGFDSSSKLLIQTIPTLVKNIDFHSLEFNSHSGGSESSRFIEISLSKIAQITEIILS